MSIAQFSAYPNNYRHLSCRGGGVLSSKSKAKRQRIGRGRFDRTVDIAPQKNYGLMFGADSCDCQWGIKALQNGTGLKEINVVLFAMERKSFFACLILFVKHWRWISISVTQFLQIKGTSHPRPITIKARFQADYNAASNILSSFYNPALDIHWFKRVQ